MTTPRWLTYPKSILISQNTSFCTSSEASVSTVNQDKRSFLEPSLGLGSSYWRTARHSAHTEGGTRLQTWNVLSWSKTPGPVATDSFLHAEGTLGAALSLPSAGSPVWLLGLSARTCSEPSILSIRFLLCVLMYVNLGLVRLFCSHKQNTRLHWCQKRRRRRRLPDGSQHRAGLLWVAPKHNPSLKCWFCFTEKGSLSFSSCSILSTLPYQRPQARALAEGFGAEFVGGTRPVLIVLPISFSLIGSKQSSWSPVNRLLLALTFTLKDGED